MNKTNLVIYLDIDGVQYDLYERFTGDRSFFYQEGVYLSERTIGDPNSAISELKEAGYTIRLLSSMVNSPYCENEKRAWIHRELTNIDDDEIILVPEGSSKYDYVLVNENTLLVDDYSGNLRGWQELKGRCIKFDVTGRDDKEFRVISDLHQLLKLL